MMTIRSLAEVRARLESLPGTPDSAANPQRQFEDLEGNCIQVLDSEFSDFLPGELEEYLQTYLYLRQLELGLIPFPDPREE